MGLTLFASMPAARKWLIIGGAGIAAMMGLVGATQPVVQQKIGYFIEQMSDFGNTPYGQLYTAAWRLWQQHPVTGIGPQQFLEACRPEVLQVSYCDVHPHNMYMEWLVATGLPGILLFVGAMALILRRFLREAPFSGTRSILTACGLSEFAAVLFPFVVTQSVFSNWSAALFWYSLGLGMSLLQLAPDTRHDPAH
jgi:O-antigen ligase